VGGASVSTKMRHPTLLPRLASGACPTPAPATRRRKVET
jgi:hypothetical protein